MRGGDFAFGPWADLIKIARWYGDSACQIQRIPALSRDGNCGFKAGDRYRLRLIGVIMVVIMFVLVIMLMRMTGRQLIGDSGCRQCNCYK